MISMISFCGGIHTILTNKREGNINLLLKRVNKIALCVFLENTYHSNFRIWTFCNRKVDFSICVVLLLTKMRRGPCSPPFLLPFLLHPEWDSLNDIQLS
ncbi:hypothetical protein RHMOL_Rhmol09G0198500 [Rhododendron molle]|uniref:Uncharacterized protein n=1 Tax=Rhododendron molle TaxID=49168 RepID=A0ACC0MFG0_RHOML|nr:hypothetical protein RHMOL_Rhmol09G0198500 [Rhododendron molle]